MLVTLTLPETMDTIGYEAFSGCTSLKQMDLPEGLTYLGEHAFKNCKALETLSLPNTLESIENVFYKCLALKTISVKPNHPTMSSEGGMLYDHNRTELIYAGGGVEGDITLPDTLTQIRESALDDCYYITGIVLPGGLNDIDPMTFKFCSAMEWIQVSDANQDYASHDGMLFEKDLANLVLPGWPQERRDASRQCVSSRTIRLCHVLRCSFHHRSGGRRNTDRAHVLQM